MHSSMARTRAAPVLLAAIVAGAALVSGGSPADPRTPPALPGLSRPFSTAAVLGGGGLSAGVDPYGDLVDLRPAAAGPPLIDNSHERQAAGSVPTGTGVVPLATRADGLPRPFWRADRVRQRYLPGTNVLRTEARFGRQRVTLDCAAGRDELACTSNGASLRFARHVAHPARRRLHLDDRRARSIIAAAAASDRHWLDSSRPLGPRAPGWAQAMYDRSLLVLRALTDARGGAAAAGARDGWAYVWPRDAGAVAIALAAAGHRAEAARVARFLCRLQLGSAARFDGGGRPVTGRPAQGDAAGWAAAAAAAAGLRPSCAPASTSWRNRADYQEKSPGNYLANALATADGPIPVAMRRFSAHRRGGLGGFVTRRGLVRERGNPGSGLDSAAAWAVRPFRHPALLAAARRTLLALPAAQRRRFGPGATRYGLIPSEGWPDADPWTAPTAWSAWALASLSRIDAPGPVARRERRAALRLAASLRRAATPAGLLPERVDARTGVARSTTPLAWSHAFAILALAKLWPHRPILDR